jgi:hypothetical protein
MNVNNSISGLWPHFDRIAEISTAGGFKVFISDIEDELHPQKLDDIKSVKEFYKDWCIFVESIDEADIITDLNKVNYFSYFDRRAVSDFSGYKNVNIAPASMDITDQSTIKLFKVATERLNFSLNDIRKCAKIGAIIAAMDGCVDIAPRHIAEAIQYRVKPTI